MRNPFSSVRSLFPSGGADDSRDTLDSSGALPLQLVFLIVGLVVILLYAIASGANFLAVVSVGILVAGGGLLVGGLIGFLFGIPRTLVYDRLPSGTEVGNANREEDRRLPEFDPNTNLEQISDWLTKILVGVGLTQLGEAAGALSRGATAIQGAFGNPPQSHVFALALLVYFPMCGFFVGYLWARLFLPNALTRAERLRWEEKTRNQKEVEAILVEASRQEAGQPSDEGLKSLNRGAQRMTGLWVDDNPANNASLKPAFEKLLGIEIDLSLSTDDALQKLRSNPDKYRFVISDMGRPPDSRAGYTLLQALKAQGGRLPPYIIYATGAGNPANRAEAELAGAYGSTNSAQELLQLVRSALGMPAA